MGLRAADVRFVLPHAVHRAVVLGPVPRWGDALAEAGVEVVQPGSGAIDLVVATPEHVRDAVRVEATSVVVAGQTGRPLRRAGYEVTRLFQRLGPDGPRLLVPLGERAPLAHFVLGPASGRSLSTRLRNRAVVWALRAGAPASGLVVTVATRQPGPPRFLDAAAGIGAPVGRSWGLELGERDDLQRAVWLCFDAGQPAWAVKCSRTPGNVAPFDADERGLATVAGLTRDVLAHVPRLLGRIEVDDLHGSVETAARGSTLLLQLDGPRRGAAAHQIIGRVCDWIIEVGRQSAGPACTVPMLLGRLHDAQTDGTPLALSLAAEVGAVPAVIAHNDLATWNVLVDGDDFTVIDWEFARPAGPPLWDLLYFATDALSVAARPADPVGRLQRCVDLLAGDLPESGMLFDVIGRGADAHGLPPAAVGRLATLCWLHHEGRHQRRAARVARAATASAPPPDVDPRFEPPAHLIASRWMTHPALGPEWAAYAARRT